MRASAVEFRNKLLLLILTVLGQNFLVLLLVMFWIWDYFPGFKQPRLELDAALVLTIGFLLSIAMILTIQQLTYWNEIGDRLAETERLALIGQATAGITHEIRNPLTGMRGFLQLLEKASAGTPSVSSETVQKYVGIVQEQVSALDQITSEFLLLARRPQTNGEPVHFNQLINTTLSVFEAEATQTGVGLVLRLEPGLPVLTGDGDQLAKVLRNLFKNALESMPNGGCLRIATSYRREEKQVVLEVEDSGVGINPEHIPRIFDPFFTSKKSGTGLGLAICKRVVNDHGGTIQVQSKLGRGTIFTVSLPLDRSLELELPRQPAGGYVEWRPGTKV